MRFPKPGWPRATTQLFCAATLALASAATLVLSPGASASLTRSATDPVAVNVSGSALGPSIAAGFVGIANEFWGVENEVGTNPNSPDQAFEQIVRNLAPYGGLTFRVGGDSSDWAWWPIAGMKQPPWVRWTMTPTWLAVTKRLVSDLHAHLIVGINMEADSSKITMAEVNAIKTGIGSSIPITYELGNEPELYSKYPYYHDASGKIVLGRPKGYSYSDMTTQWSQLAGTLGDVPLAGPGYSSLKALSDVGSFLAANRRVSLLTVHTYPLRAPSCTASHTPLEESDLFTPSALQSTATELGSWTSTAGAHGVPVRVDEMNSVTCGGSFSFSKTFGPSLWALNALALYAEAGASGVNFQNKPSTAQNLIQPTDTHAGWRVAVQPEYYGLLAFAQLTPPGSKMLSLSKTPAGLYSWAVRTPQGQTHVVLTNVGDGSTTVSVKATGGRGPATVELLKAASNGLKANTGVTLAGQTVSPSTGQLVGKQVSTTVDASAGAYDVTVPASSAAIVTFKG